MFCCFPYGALALTAVYAAYCYVILAVLLGLDGDCSSSEECRAEGVDNAPIAYLSQLFVGGILCLLGIHIVMSLRSDGPRCKAALAFFVWAASHVVWGIIGWKYGNDGTGDGKGQRVYFYLDLLAYGLHTEALMEVATLAMRLWFLLYDEYKPSVCGKTMVRFLQLMLGLTTATIAAGCLWCGSLPDVWVQESLDKYPNDMDLPVHMCIQMVDISQLVYTFVSALVWMAVASLYGSYANQQIAEFNKWYYVWGVPTPLAAAAVVGCQGAIVLFHLLAYLIVERISQSEPDDEVLAAGSIAYHYASLMTGYFVHSLVYSMSIRRGTYLLKTNLHDEEEGPIDNDEDVINQTALEVDDDELSNELYKKIQVIPSYLSEGSTIDNTDGRDDTEGTEEDINLSMDRREMENCDIETAANDREIAKEPSTFDRGSAMTPRIELTSMTMEDENMAELVGEETTYIAPGQQQQQCSQPSLTDDNQSPSHIPLDRTATNDLASNTVCGFSLPWMTTPNNVSSRVQVDPPSTLMDGDDVDSLDQATFAMSEGSTALSPLSSLEERDIATASTTTPQQGIPRPPPETLPMIPEILPGPTLSASKTTTTTTMMAIPKTAPGESQMAAAAAAGGSWTAYTSGTHSVGSSSTYEVSHVTSKGDDEQAATFGELLHVLCSTE
jgi:hypothetical protein